MSSEIRNSAAAISSRLARESSGNDSAGMLIDRIWEDSHVHQNTLEPRRWRVRARRGVCGIGSGNPPRAAIFHGLPAAQRDGAPAAHREACQGAGPERPESVVVYIQRADRGQRGADFRQYRRRLGRRAWPAGVVVAHQRDAAGSARHFRPEFAAVPAQQPRPGDQDHQGFQGQRPHRGAGRTFIGAGDHAANGGSKSLWHQRASIRSTRSRCR